MTKKKTTKKAMGADALRRQVALLVNKVKKEKDGKKKYAQELDDMEHSINELKRSSSSEKQAKELKVMLDEVK
jgi:hypothetical protein